MNFAVEPQRMALINVDMQNCFVHNSPIAAPDGLDLLVRINQLAGSGATYTLSQNAWYKFWYIRRIDMSSLSGKEIQLRFTSATRSGAGFYVDNVVFE